MAAKPIPRCGNTPFHRAAMAHSAPVLRVLFDAADLDETIQRASRSKNELGMRPEEVARASRPAAGWNTDLADEMRRRTASMALSIPHDASKPIRSQTAWVTRPRGWRDNPG